MVAQRPSTPAPDAVPASACRICGSTAVLGRHTATEMMFGTRERFGYFQCAHCLCLQINTIPDDLARHYASGYYSYRPAQRRANPVKRWAARLRDRHAVFGGGGLGRLLFARSPVVELRSLRPLQLQRDSRVLDVGCGAGFLVFALGEIGLRHAEGIDPFVPEPIVYDNGVKVRKRDIFQAEGPWDAIMFHHSFEHLADPGATLARVAELLAPGGQCLLRVPTVSSLAWREYGVDWVQLDAPRHLHLFAHESIRHLAAAHGFEVEAVVCDGTAFQFWGSEQYRMGIPLNDERSFARNPGAGLFSVAQIAEFTRRSLQLNRDQQGDQAAFYLRKRRPAAPPL